MFEAIIRRRVNDLIQYANSWGREVRLHYLDRILPVLVEKETGKGRLIQGLTPNYLKVCFQGDRHSIGEVVKVQLLALEGDMFLGRRLT